MGKILKDNEGLYFMATSGIRYELLEGVCIGSPKRLTSDFFFIMNDNPDYDFDERIVGYLFGASLLEDPDQIGDYEETISGMVEDFEKRQGLEVMR